MEFPIKFGITVKSRWSIVSIEESKFIMSKNYYISFSEDWFLSKQTVQTLTKGRIMWHFIWVFTVCQSACLGVSVLKRVKVLYEPHRKSVYGECEQQRG